MKKTVALLLTFLLLTQSVFAVSFTDTSNHWSENYILRLAKHLIINGYPDHTFKPEETITKAEFIKLLTASMRYPLKQHFVSWHDGYYRTLKTEGILTKDLSYLENAPNSPIRRIEAIKLISNMLEKENALQGITLKTAPFSDITSDVAVNRSYTLNIITGYPDGTLKPNGTLKRGEVAKIFDVMFFGVYDSYNDLVKLPIFDTYTHTFDTINQARYLAYKDGKTPRESHKNDVDVEVDDNYQMIAHAEDLIEMLKYEKNSRFVDVRDQTAYDFVHLKKQSRKVLMRC